MPLSAIPRDIQCIAPFVFLLQHLHKADHFGCVRRLFFFSSRRRHTRLQGDWSSDVCSSDLTATPPPHTPLALTTQPRATRRSEEHTSELQSPCNLVCRLLLEKKKTTDTQAARAHRAAAAGTHAHTISPG